MFCWLATVGCPCTLVWASGGSATKQLFMESQCVVQRHGGGGAVKFVYQRSSPTVRAALWLHEAPAPTEETQHFYTWHNTIKHLHSLLISWNLMRCVHTGMKCIDD